MRKFLWTVVLSKGKYPYYRLELDKWGTGYNYSIQQTYGVDSSFFGKPFNSIIQPQIPQTA